MSAKPVPPVTVANSAVHMLQSEHTGREYRITVRTPFLYSKAPDEWPPIDTPERYPVVYVLDGNFFFGMVADTIRMMRMCGGINDAIVVGIGYAEDQNPREAYRDTASRRQFDFTPIRDEEAERSLEQMLRRPSPTGDAGNFHQFIKAELIPFVEQNYSADPSRRTLVGHSDAGLFTLFSLFETPGLFEKVIVGSPSLNYGNEYVFKGEETFAKEYQKLPVELYLFAGADEETVDDRTVSQTLRLADILESRKYEGFSLVKHIFSDRNHCEVVAPGFQWGLQLALKKPG